MAGIHAKGQDVKQDLNAVQNNNNAVAQKEQTAEEWKTFNIILPAYYYISPDRLTFLRS